MKLILKCLGGKSRLVGTLTYYLPRDIRDNNYSYIEPFVGGASVSLYLTQNKYIAPENCYINDGNKDISNLYWTIQQNPEYFTEIYKEYSECVSQEDFDKIKNKFNSPKYLSWEFSSNTEDSYHRAAMFLALNHVCFNGLIRYNRSGIFNSPWGKYKTHKIFTKDEIVEFSNALKPINLNTRLGEDFESYVKRTVEELKDKNIFLYLDPPYIPISVTSSFTQYTDKGFSFYDNYRLRSLLDWLNERGHKFLLSNSSCSLTRDLFRGYNIKSLCNVRYVSASKKGRGNIKELLIKNY